MLDQDFPFGLVVAPFGEPIGIRTNCRDLLEEVRLRLLPGWCELPAGPCSFCWSLHRDESRSFARYQDRQWGHWSEFDRYFHLYVGDTARGVSFFHAGVVGLAGGALLLPGNSYAGKSRLTWALVQLGATYYSDDLAVIDELGRVHPYPKPLSLREDRVVKAGELGWRPDLPPLPVAWAAMLHYSNDEHAAWEELPPARLSQHLVRHCLGMRREPTRNLGCIARLCARLRSWEGRRGEASQAARRLLDLTRVTGQQEEGGGQVG